MAKTSYLQALLTGVPTGSIMAAERLSRFGELTGEPVTFTERNDTVIVEHDCQSRRMFIPLNMSAYGWSIVGRRYHGDSVTIALSRKVTCSGCHSDFGATFTRRVTS